MKGSFAEEKLSDFLNDLINGRSSLEDVKKLVFKKVDKWDGKDAAPLEEDVSIYNFTQYINYEITQKIIYKLQY